MNFRCFVDPELAGMLTQVPTIPLNDSTLSQWRTMLSDRPLPPTDPRISVETWPIDAGRKTDEKLTLISYRPIDADETLPALIHFHGGGFVMGNAKHSGARCSDLALSVRCHVFSVDYRLAPEAPYPAQLEDAYAALRWISLKSSCLRIDPDRVGLVGESAGAGLAAALAIAARDRSEFAVAYQLLLYPMLDDRTVKKSPAGAVGKFIWTPAHNEFAWRSFLGPTPPCPYAAPARLENAVGLPPTFLATGALDLFVEENLSFASLLVHAGVALELHVFPGAVHGFDLVVASRAAASLRTLSIAALKRALCTPQSETEPHSPKGDYTE